MGTNSDSPSLKIITNNVDEYDPERHNQQSNWIDKLIKIMKKEPIIFYDNIVPNSFVCHITWAVSLLEILKLR